MDIFLIIAMPIRIVSGEGVAHIQEQIAVKAFVDRKSAEIYAEKYYQERRVDEYENFVDIPLKNDGSIPYEVYSRLNEDFMQYENCRLWIKKIELVDKSESKEENEK